MIKKAKIAKIKGYGAAFMFLWVCGGDSKVGCTKTLGLIFRICDLE